MRKLTLTLALLALCAATPGCKKSKQPVQYVEEGASQLSSAINVADPRTAIQLLRGFHGVENNAWRWTGPKFAVALRPPKEVTPEGGKLYLDYTMPDVFLQKVPQTTLSISVNGKTLDPETINKAGTFKLERAVPAAALQGDVVTVEFSLDKFLESGSVDQRELGLIVSAVGVQGPTPPSPPAPAGK